MQVGRVRRYRVPLLHRTRVHVPGHVDAGVWSNEGKGERERENDEGVTTPGVAVFTLRSRGAWCRAKSSFFSFLFLSLSLSPSRAYFTWYAREGSAGEKRAAKIQNTHTRVYVLRSNPFDGVPFSSPRGRRDVESAGERRSKTNGPDDRHT